MNSVFKDQFISQWKKYFKNAELPITFWYSDETDGANRKEPVNGHSCLICELAKVRNGESLAYDENALGCAGAKRYLGFKKTIREGFNYFLSCGNDEIEGERYIRTPEMVNELMKNQKMIERKGSNIIFKRWDKLSETDQPEVIIFFAKPDVIAGLFTLANFDQTEPNGTFTPFGAGCGSIIHYPYLEIDSDRPRAVIGMFDPSARPCVPQDMLTFAVPIVKFEKMIGYMDESFLITPTWETVMKRLD